MSAIEVRRLVGGDRAAAHDMFALQVIPFMALLLELGARRIPMLRGAPTRLGLLWILVSSYLGALALLTVQTLAWQSVVRPDAALTMWGVTLLAVAGLAVVVILTRGGAQ